MASRTVSLEQSAYDRLKAAKRPGESFTEVVNRILGGHRPTYQRLAGFLGREDAARVQDAILRMRALEAPAEQAGSVRMRRSHGNHD